MLEIDEPIRETLHLDQDRQGIPGSHEPVGKILDNQLGRGRRCEDLF